MFGPNEATKLAAKQLAYVSGWKVCFCHGVELWSITDRPGKVFNGLAARQQIRIDWALGEQGWQQLEDGTWAEAY